MPIRAAIIEDVETVREGIAALMERGNDLICVAKFADAESALQRIGPLNADVILVDIGLPGQSGIDLARQVKARIPEILIMMLTVYEDDERIFESLKAGASGYILKDTPPERLISAIKELYNGGSPMSPSIARKVVEAFQSPSSDEQSELTEREREILSLLCQGYRYREIAERLFVSIDTVRAHVRHVYEKLHVNSRYELLSRGRRNKPA